MHWPKTSQQTKRESFLRDLQLKVRPRIQSHGGRVGLGWILATGNTNTPYGIVNTGSALWACIYSQIQITSSDHDRLHGTCTEEGGPKFTPTSTSAATTRPTHITTHTTPPRPVTLGPPHEPPVYSLSFPSTGASMCMLNSCLGSLRKTATGILQISKAELSATGVGGRLGGRVDQTYK